MQRYLLDRLPKFKFTLNIPLTMSEVPEIEIYISDTTIKAGGIGEPVFPSVAPAVANAIFKATGVRLRQLPFQRELLAKG